MANDFTYDPHCVALYRFESGALIVDSKGNNTLINNNGVSEDTVNYMEGACSAFFTRTSNQYFNVLDSALDAGFPMKSGDTNKKISICCRYRPINSGNFEGLVSKRASGKFTFCLHKDSDDKIAFYIGTGVGDSSEGKTHASALTCDGTKKYFIAVTYDDSDKSVFIHVYDLGAGSQLGDNISDNMLSNINVEDADFRIGYAGAAFGYLDGNLDEIPIFNDILAIDEVDQIRAGTYSYPGITTSSAISVLYDSTDEDSTVSCDNESSDFPLGNAFEKDRPFKRFHSQDTSETTIELGYESMVNTIFLCNCNFSGFKFEYDGNQTDLNTVMDKDIGIYNAVIRLLPFTGIISFKIIIPSQNTVNGESFFAIGVIAAFSRKELSAKPQYSLRKRIVEPVHEIRFDLQNREIQETGRPYHLLEFNWNTISANNFKEIEDAVREIGQDGLCVIHEKWSDYEASYLCQMHGDFPFSRIKNFYRHPLNFRELM